MESCPTLVGDVDISPLATPMVDVDVDPMDLDDHTGSQMGDFETFKRVVGERLDVGYGYECQEQEDDDDDDEFWTCRGLPEHELEGMSLDVDAAKRVDEQLAGGLEKMGVDVLRWLGGCDGEVRG